MNNTIDKLTHQQIFDIQFKIADKLVQEFGYVLGNESMGNYFTPREFTDLVKRIVDSVITELKELNEYPVGDEVGMFVTEYVESLCHIKNNKVILAKLQTCQLDLVETTYTYTLQVRKNLKDYATTYYIGHKKAFESWSYGFIDKIWVDADGYLCIQYETGDWFHYDENGSWWR